MEYRKLTHTFTREEMLNLSRLHFLLHAIENNELKIYEDSPRGLNQREILKDSHETIRKLLKEDFEIFKEDMSILKAGQ